MKQTGGSRKQTYNQQPQRPLMHGPLPAALEYVAPDYRDDAVRLARALVKYGKHVNVSGTRCWATDHEDCDGSCSFKTCTCGLTAALELAAKVIDDDHTRT